MQFQGKKPDLTRPLNINCTHTTSGPIASHCRACLTKNNCFILSEGVSICNHLSNMLLSGSLKSESIPPNLSLLSSSFICITKPTLKSIESKHRLVTVECTEYAQSTLGPFCECACQLWLVVWMLADLFNIP